MLYASMHGGAVQGETMEPTEYDYVATLCRVDRHDECEASRAVLCACPCHGTLEGRLPFLLAPQWGHRHWD